MLDIVEISRAVSDGKKLCQSSFLDLIQIFLVMQQYPIGISAKTAAPPEGLDIVNFKSDGTSKGATRSLSISFTDNTPLSLTESSKKVPLEI